MSDTTKPMVVCIDPAVLGKVREGHVQRRTFTLNRPFFAGEQPYLLLPIEDGALRVGDYLLRYRWEYGAEYRKDGDPESEWCDMTDDTLWDILHFPLMDAVEGVEP